MQLNDEFDEKLLREVGVDERGVARRLRYVGFETGEEENIATLRETVEAHADALSAGFFEFLASQDGGRGLQQNANALSRARALKRAHLHSMVHGPYGTDYARERIRLAQLYGSVGVEPSAFMGAFNHLLQALGELAVHGSHATTVFPAYMSLKKVAFFDLGVMVDTLIYERQKVIRQQQDAIRELSTPVLQLRDRMLLLPLVGIVDTLRARQLTEDLLKAIRSARAKVVVMDITGTAAVDSKVANHLLQTVSAAKLMGATVIISGVSSEIATTLVSLGVDVDRFDTVGDLQEGIEEAERLLGIQVVMEGVPSSTKGP